MPKPNSTTTVKRSKIITVTLTLFQIANTLLHKEKNTSLPSHSSPSQLADRFAGYFTEKIASIRNNPSYTKCLVDQLHVSELVSPKITPLQSFREVEEKDVSKLIMSGNSKSCLDPIPSKVLKQVFPSILPSINIHHKHIIHEELYASLTQANCSHPS